MQEVERLRIARGCPKLNLQVRAHSHAAVGFYRALGYVQDDLISLGWRLSRTGSDNPQNAGKASP